MVLKHRRKNVDFFQYTFLIQNNFYRYHVNDTQLLSLIIVLHYLQARCLWNKTFKNNNFWTCKIKISQLLSKQVIDFICQLSWMVHGSCTRLQKRLCVNYIQVTRCLFVVYNVLDAIDSLITISIQYNHKSQKLRKRFYNMDLNQLWLPYSSLLWVH